MMSRDSCALQTHRQQPRAGSLQRCSSRSHGIGGIRLVKVERRPGGCECRAPWLSCASFVSTMGMRSVTPCVGCLCADCASLRQRGRQECIKRALTCSPVRRWGSGATSFTHGLRFPLMLCVTVLVQCWCVYSLHASKTAHLSARDRVNSYFSHEALRGVCSRHLLASGAPAIRHLTRPVSFHGPSCA